jgi:C-terminal processing protease CtpA/Prc
VTGSRNNSTAAGTNANRLATPQARAGATGSAAISPQSRTGQQGSNPAAARAAQPSTQTQPGIARNTRDPVTGRLNTTDVTPRNSATSGQNTLTSEGRVTDSRFSDNRIDDRFTDPRTDSRFTDSRVDDRFTDNRVDDRFTDSRTDDRFTDSRVDDRFTDNRTDDRFTDGRVDDRFSDSRLNDRFPDARVTDSNATDFGSDLGQNGQRLLGETMSTEGGRPQLGVTFYDSLTNGATIAAVLPDTAAERAGLRRGDQILSINGRRFDDYRDALDYIDVFRGSRMDLVVLRNGEHVQLATDITTEPRASRDDRPSLGVWFNPSNNLTIGRTLPGSIAFSAGFRPGDRVVAIEGEPVTTQRALTRYLADLQPNERVNVEVSRNGRRIRLNAELAEMARGDRDVNTRRQAPAARMAERETRDARTNRETPRDGSTGRQERVESPRRSIR